MKQGQSTDQPANRQGFVQIPNSLCRLGTPLQVLIYARLGSTSGIQVQRGKLGPYEVQASRADLADSTGATDDKIRGALAALVRDGHLTRLDTLRTATAVYRFPVPIPKREGNVKPTIPTPYTNGNGGQSPRLKQKGQKLAPSLTVATATGYGVLHTGQRAKVCTRHRQQQQHPPNPPKSGGGDFTIGWVLHRCRVGTSLSASWLGPYRT